MLLRRSHPRHKVKCVRIHSLITALSLCGCAATPSNPPRRAWLAAEQPRLETAKFDAHWAALSSVFAEEHGLVGSGCLPALLVPEHAPEELVYVNCEGARDGVSSRVVRLSANQRVATTGHFYVTLPAHTRRGVEGVPHGESPAGLSKALARNCSGAIRRQLKAWRSMKSNGSS